MKMLKMTIEINKKLLPSIKKHNLERDIQMRIMKRVGELKKELSEIEAGTAGDGGEDAQSTGTTE